MNEATSYAGTDAREAALSLCARFGQQLRSLRLSSKCSVAELAFEAEISPGLLEQLESGLHEPDLILLSRLATALNLSLSELLVEL